MDPHTAAPTPLLAIKGFRLEVADVARSTTFYVALGFRAVAPGRLTFDAVVLELVARTGPPCRNPAANDSWFQHFAIAVADITAGAALALAAGATPITRGGPQLLPANTGSVTAWKFRDLDGHPLELSVVPGSRWLSKALPGTVFLGVDHTAIVVSDLAVSQAWYEALSFRVTGRSRNQGSEQDRLDDLADVIVDIVALAPPGIGPHLELLCYEAPQAAQSRSEAGSMTASATTLTTCSVALRDPDGHRLGPALPA